jgi:hypothetical protein
MTTAKRKYHWRTFWLIIFGATREISNLLSVNLTWQNGEEPKANSKCDKAGKKSREPLKA